MGTTDDLELVKLEPEHAAGVFLENTENRPSYPKTPLTVTLTHLSLLP